MSERRDSYNPLLKSYPDSDKINSCSIGSETLFTRLIAQSDDANHYYGDAPMVLGKLFTERMSKGEVDLAMVRGWINELATAGLILLYQNNGKQFIEIVNCRKDLRSDVKLDIRFPSREQTICDKSTARNRLEIEPNSTRIRTSNPTQPNPTQPKNTLPAEAGGVSLPNGFVGFWTEWPKHHRKQGKTKCLTHWKRHKLEAISEKVISSLSLFKHSDQWHRDGGAYIPFPMTWLNRTPWETDESDLAVDPSEDDGLDPADRKMLKEMEIADERRRQTQIAR